MKILPLLIFGCLFHTFTYAQPESKEKLSLEERAEKNVDRLEKSLELTKEQRQQLYEIQLNSLKERKELMEKRKAEKLEKEKLHDQKMKSILNQEQYEKYLELKGAMKMKREMKRREHRHRRVKKNDIK